MLKKALFIALGAVTCWASCTIDDGDRCLDGYEYDTKVRACTKIETDTDSDTGPADVPQDAGGDSGANGDSAGDLPSGYLEFCEKQEDCAAYEADYCLLNPQDAAQSACVTQNCIPGSCPLKSICCDCSMVTLPTMCLPEEATQDELLATMCDCEG